MFFYRLKRFDPVDFRYRQRLRAGVYNTFILNDDE